MPKGFEIEDLLDRDGDYLSHLFGDSAVAEGESVLINQDRTLIEGDMYPGAAPNA